MNESRIVVRNGHGGPGSVARTVVEFPFTDCYVTISGSEGKSFTECVRSLDDLSPHERDIVIMNLCVKYGTVK